MEEKKKRVKIDITLEERKLIEECLNKNSSLFELAKSLKRCYSTLNREYQRVFSKFGRYNAEEAHDFALSKVTMKSDFMRKVRINGYENMSQKLDSLQFQLDIIMDILKKNNLC